MNMTVLPGLADDGSGPVFASPWQAQIFSLVVGLHESGCFSWNEWAEALSREIAEDSSGGADGVMTHEEIDPSDSYYGLWSARWNRFWRAKPSWIRMKFGSGLPSGAKPISTPLTALP